MRDPDGCKEKLFSHEDSQTLEEVIQREAAVSLHP